MKTFIIVLVVTVLIFAAGGVVYAKKSGICSGPDGRASWAVDRVSRKLDLNETQRLNLALLKDKLLFVRGEFASKKEEGRQQLINLLTSSELDQTEAQLFFEQYRERASHFSTEVIEAIATFTDSLTQGQRDQLINWVGQRNACGYGRHCG